MIVVLFSLLTFLGLGDAGWTITEQHDCKFNATSDEKERVQVDLTSLSSFDSTPSFNVIDENGVYYWNPCQMFLIDKNYTLPCDPASVVLAASVTCTVVGVYGIFVMEDEDLWLNYSASLHESARIRLVCDDIEKQFSCQDCTDPFHPVFELRSRSVCLGGLRSKATQAASLMGMVGPGTLVLITAFSVVSVYLIIGIIHGFVKGSKGIDRLPNSDFWIELPYLVKDGTLFVLRGCRTGGVHYSPIIEDKNIPIADV